MLKEHEKVIELCRTESSALGGSGRGCSVESLLARLTKVEVLLGRRDSNLHPGLVDASQRIDKCKLDHASYPRANDAYIL